MEQLVRATVPDFMEKNDICKCEDCFEDVCALTLNSLPPLYKRLSDRQEIDVFRQSTSRQLSMDINIKIINAIDTVKKNPRH
jgi:competence protein ComFB